jgi:hypothetical protein
MQAPASSPWLALGLILLALAGLTTVRVARRRT